MDGTYDGGHSGAWIENEDGTLSISGGRYSAGKVFAAVGTSGGTLNISSGRFFGGDNNDALKCLAGNVNITGGYFSSGKSKAIYIADSNNVTISGGIFETHEDHDLIIEKGTLNITGGNFSSTEAGGIGVGKYANATIENVTVNVGSNWNGIAVQGQAIFKSGKITASTNGIWVGNGGKLDIKGGTIICDNFEQQAIDCDSGGSVTITGGTFYNTAGGRAAIVGDEEGPVAKFTVNGGKFYTNNDSKKCPYSSGTDWRYYSTILVWQYSNKAYSWNSNTSYVRNDIGKYTYWNYDANQLSSNAIGTP